MIKRKKYIKIIITKKHLKNCLLTLISFQLFIHQSIASENYPQVEIVTTSGSFIIELDRNKAPLSVENFLSYVEEGFYANTIFHRVIEVSLQGLGTARITLWVHFPFLDWSIFR